MNSTNGSGGWSTLLNPRDHTWTISRPIEIGSRSQRREAAKDATSFANELGGTLLYGIPQRDGPDKAPVPAKPYGMAPIGGLEEDLENIFMTVISPMLPEFRIRRVGSSEYPGKVVYVIRTPESWMGPHMVQGYEDGRFYRRGQFRAVTMPERDVEERYRQRLLRRDAAIDFVGSEEARHLRLFVGRNVRPPRLAQTFLCTVPLLLTPDRVRFEDGSMGDWLSRHTLWSQWSPSMYGVRTGVTHAVDDRAEVEVHRHGAIVCWRHTSISDPRLAHVLLTVTNSGSYWKFYSWPGSSTNL